MIELGFFEGLIKALDESSLDSIEIERGGTRIRLSKTAPPASPATEERTWSDASPPAETESAGMSPEEPASSNLVDVKSPMVGTFYRSAAPDAPAYVERGTRVKKGDTLCIIEAMKLMNELESEVDGVVAEICIENAVPIEYGQVLFRIDPGP
ncbi:MAG TPA: acetyl-CoA carboxylase biotin carboxyl carrier protein [Gemmatimonadetes bacterium]|nr:acetyl-CoA carboxylase biotin carboxyl carrier protein [Gemmatimonadota bacterium]|tara:strand:+ start:12538 stop:12996 length:459 start_codon:yes stop_codon:yes gene_type:complete